MNELLEQFLAESRELVQEGTDDLLALEGRPDDPERLDRVFRVFHTLKGSAGIFDFPPLALVLHTAEEVLSAMRAGQRMAPEALVDRALACLDQVAEWCDAIEASGGLPQDAQEVAAELAAALRETAPLAGRSNSAVEQDGVGADWVRRLVVCASARSETAAFAQELLAIRYEPRAQCFFDGDDPLAVVRRLPGLVALRVEPREPWPAPADMDPFLCNLVILALLRAPASEAMAVLRLVRDQVQVVELPAQALRTAERAGPPREENDLPHAVIAEQRRLLHVSATGDGFGGCLGAAVRCACNVLRRQGRAAAVQALMAAQSRAIAEANAGPVIYLLDRFLEGDGPAPEPEGESQARTASKRAGAASRSLRIDVSKIDALVSLMGELVVAKNGLAHLSRLAEQDVDRRVLARTIKDQQDAIDRLVSNMQRAVLGVRMVPVDQVFRRFPRPVREIASKLGKQVSLVTEGGETEVDKAIVDTLFEPLLHLVRNALDHGIEAPEERRRQGKNPTGRLVLRAAHRGENVVIEVADDGYGIDPAVVRRVATERGIAAADAIEALPDQAANELVFAPGFSTASQVSDLSGRGVGMDAVRVAAERLRGRVGIESVPGQGTTIRLVLPLSLAMTRIVIVHAGGEPFGIPMEAVVETARVPRGQISSIRGGRAVALRDRTIPVVALDRLLNREPARGPEAPEAVLLLTDIGGEAVGVEVDRLEQRLEVMLKPLDGILKGMPGVVGTTLMGDGRLLLVLDLKELIG